VAMRGATAEGRADQINLSGAGGQERRGESRDLVEVASGRGDDGEHS
jgi:hypothetical protein